MSGLTRLVDSVFLFVIVWKSQEKRLFFFLQLSNVCCKARNGEACPYIGIKVRYQLKSLSKFYFLFPLLLLGILLSTDRRSFSFFLLKKNVRFFLRDFTIADVVVLLQLNSLIIIEK